MAAELAVLDDRVVAELSGWDRAMNWRSEVVFDYTNIESASDIDRSSLENLIDHRTSGCGTHDGLRRPNRRRIGTMLGRGIVGKQFWVVPAGPGAARLLVLDLRDHEFARAVLAIDDVKEVVAAIKQSLTSNVGERERSD